MKKTDCKLMFLGSGSAFTVGDGNYHSNMLLITPSAKMLIDCGSDIRHSLHEQGLTADDIDAVYVSHLHGDHVGGLEWLGFKRMFNSKKSKPKLFISKTLIDPLWQNVLSGGMKSLEDKEAKLEDFFEINVIHDSSIFYWESIKFELVKTLHVKNNLDPLPSFGLFISNSKKVLITTDTQFSFDHLKQYFDSADIIFQDCETSTEQSGVHAHYQQLTTLTKKIKSKMWLYHYNPGQLPDSHRDGFLGFVKKGQIFMI